MNTEPSVFLSLAWGGRRSDDLADGVDVGEVGDLLHYHAELGVAVDGEGDEDGGYGVDGLGVDAAYGEVKAVGDAVYKVNDHVGTVDADHFYLDGIQGVVGIEVDADDVVAKL